jgi:hypothetical protein
MFFKPLKLIHKLYSHILSFLLLFHDFLDSRLFLIIKICDQILIITVRKHNRYKMYSLFSHHYVITF